MTNYKTQFFVLPATYLSGNTHNLTNAPWKTTRGGINSWGNPTADETRYVVTASKNMFRWSTHADSTLSVNKNSTMQNFTPTPDVS